MDGIIETVASGLGNGVGWLAEHGVLFGVFVLIWIAFGAGLLWSQGSVDQVWETIRGLPLIVQAVVWLLFLPVMIGLWIWETSWPLIVRGGPRRRDRGLEPARLPAASCPGRSALTGPLRQRPASSTGTSTIWACPVSTIQTRSSSAGTAPGVLRARRRAGQPTGPSAYK